MIVIITQGSDASKRARGGKTETRRINKKRVPPSLFTVYHWRSSWCTQLVGKGFFECNQTYWGYFLEEENLIWSHVALCTEKWKNPEKTHRRAVQSCTGLRGCWSSLSLFSTLKSGCRGTFQQRLEAGRASDAQNANCRLQPCDVNVK